MQGRNLEFIVDSGSLETITVIIQDNAGNAIDLTSTTTYATVQLHVWQPNGTTIISSAGAYGTRNLGQVTYTFSAADTAIANAGNWIGQFVCFNNDSPTPHESKRSDIFNVKIRPVY